MASPAEKIAAKKKPRSLKAARSTVHRCEIRKLRHGLRLTIKDIADHTGLSCAGLHAIENGAEVTLSSMRKIQKFFELPLDQIWPQ